MSAEDVRRRLAELVVDALEVGSAKGELDILSELFAAFGEDLAGLEAAYTSQLPHNVRAFRAAVAARLAEAAPSAAALLNELVRCGGRFVAMVDEVYARLARHAATTMGTSQTFRLRRGDVDADNLTLSPAFLEEMKRFEKKLTTVQFRQVDDEAIRGFVGFDGGEAYGTWPPSRGDGRRLADAILHLTWMAPANRADHDADLDAARTAAEELVTAAEDLVRAYMAHLDLVPDPATAGPDQVLDLYKESRPAGVLSDSQQDWRRRALAYERESFRTFGVLGVPVSADMIGMSDEFDATRDDSPMGVVAVARNGSLREFGMIGLDRQMRPVTAETNDYSGSTGMSQLAGFVAMWRRGVWAIRRQPELRERLRDPVEHAAWLRWVTAACKEVTTWLTEEVAVPVGCVKISRLVEMVEQFLNLPLWRARNLLFEVWVLCTTLTAVEGAGWDVDLSGLEAKGGVWTLSIGPTHDPVARLRCSDPAVALDVWREPERKSAAGVFTPDLAIATTGVLSRDLVVVEAKDRQSMAAGMLRRRQRGGTRIRTTDTALWVAHRYANALRPVATWVCNHCDFVDDPGPSTNHGDPWTQVHLAARFRPGNVPDAFVKSVQNALRPSHGFSPARTTPLTVVLDVTGSMPDVFDDVRQLLAAASQTQRLGPYRAVLYSDHGKSEPFLVRKLGPFEDVSALIDAARSQPEGNGGDWEEALEDALQRCREIVDDVGPHAILVITDAPPHPAAECPYGIDCATEVRGLLATGSALFVASDFQRGDDDTWKAFDGQVGFHAAPLTELIERISTATDTSGVLP